MCRIAAVLLLSALAAPSVSQHGGGCASCAHPAGFGQVQRHEALGLLHAWLSPDEPCAHVLAERALRTCPQCAERGELVQYVRRGAEHECDRWTRGCGVFLANGTRGHFYAGNSTAPAANATSERQRNDGACRRCLHVQYGGGGVAPYRLQPAPRLFEAAAAGDDCASAASAGVVRACPPCGGAGDISESTLVAMAKEAEFQCVLLADFCFEFTQRFAV